MLSDTETFYNHNYFSDGTDMNDEVSSIQNNTKLTICFYRDIDFSVYLFNLPPYASIKAR